MKRLLLKCLILTSFFTNFANASELMTAERFAQHKALTLQAIEKRDKIIEEEKDCVKASQEINSLKACFVTARQNRKEMGKELRAKIAK